MSHINELTKILLQEVAKRPDLLQGIKTAGGIGPLLRSIPPQRMTMKQRVIEMKLMCTRENLKEKMKKEKL